VTDPATPRDIVDFQLAVLDAYEKLLASCSWDEPDKLVQQTLALLEAQQ
jgi:hypothetical protein